MKNWESIKRKIFNRLARKFSIYENSDFVIKKSLLEKKLEGARKIIGEKKDLLKKREIMAFKEELANLKNQKFLSHEEELTKYINKLFEQQERERILRWLVNSIRESLDLDTVLSNTVIETGRLLRADRCLIAQYNPKKFKFYLQNEYRKNQKISSVIEFHKEITILEEWFKKLVLENVPIKIDDVTTIKPDDLDSLNLKPFQVKSLAIAPVIHKSELLGVIIVHQVEEKRIWKESHLEILKDIGSQVSIAIRQATLYMQVQETTKLKSEFLASMSHEFRTPLNAIIGFSEMLLMENYGILVDKQKEYLNNISISGKHLLKLVNNVLDLSKVESGSMDLKYETFLSSQAIEETVTILRNLAAQKNISIKLNLGDILVNADIVKFKQIMYNLISNSIKFTEENGKIEINTYFVNGKLKVEVQDNGIGISKDSRNKVFAKFSQIDSSYARKQEGTGLGLILTKKIVELHEGYIDFESEAQKGSKFWFTLPNATMLSNKQINTSEK